MQPIEAIGSYSPIGDILTCVMIVVLFFIIRSVSIKTEYSYKAFTTIFISLFVGANANIAFYLMATGQWEGDTLRFYLLRDVYHICLLFSLHMITYYMLSVIQIDDTVKKQWRTGSLAILYVGVFFDVISPFTKFGFYISEEGLWYDSFVFHPYTIAFIAYFVVYMMFLLKHKDYMLKTVVNVMASIEGFCVIVMIMQIIFEHNSFTAFLFLLPIIAMTLMLHVNSYDINTGTLGESSLVEYVERHKGARKIYCLFFNNYTVKKAKSARLYFYNFYKRYFTNVDMFLLDNNALVVIAQPLLTFNLDYQFLKESVDGFMKYGFKCSGVTFIQEFPQGIKDLRFVIDFARTKASVGEAYVFNANDNKDIVERRDIYYELRDIDLRKNIDDERVEVYVQPVKNVKTGKFDTAEALMRLHVRKYGMVMPGKFIPLAEKYKYIHTLSIIIFTRVCQYIKKYLSEGYDLKRISVNFAMQEFRDINFTKELLDIMHEVGVPNDSVAIEITESENDEEFEITQRVVSELKDLEIRMYLDDFGTGYSNFDRLFRLKLNVVKFDRSFLILASDDDTNKFLIKHFSSAFNQMGYEILFEGIETEAQEKLCMESSADYLQGFKYSRPIPIEKLGDFLVKKGEAND